MAIVRTVLPNHGLVQSQHGTPYESDMDANWATIDSLLMSQSEVTGLVVSVNAAPSAPGNFTLAHGLGRVPVAAVVMMTSGGSIWFQAATQFDGSNLYLVASDAGVTAVIKVW